MLSDKNFIDNHRYSDELLNSSGAISEFILFHSGDLSQKWRLLLFDKDDTAKWRFDRAKDINIAFIELSQSDCAALRQLGWNMSINDNLGL